MNLIALEVGDGGGDGHEKSIFINFDVTGSSLGELIQWHEEGCSILGLNFSCECSEYEERELSQAFKEALSRCGISFPGEDEDFDAEEFAEIYMLIAKLANPGLKWVRVNIESLQVGGYGFFS